MSISFNRKGFYDKHNFEIRYRGAKHLIRKLQMENSSYGRWFIPDFITNASEKIICNWLRAFFNDEGSVRRSDLRIYNTNRNGMLQVLKLLKSIGIEGKINKRKPNPPYKDARCYESLASAYYKAGDLEDARKNYEKIAQLTNGRQEHGEIYAKSFYMIGKIYQEQRKKEKAIENYQKFLDLWKDADPGIPEVEDAKKRLAGLKN